MRPQLQDGGNVTSHVGLRTRLSVWLSQIPLYTKSVLALIVGLYLIEFVFGWAEPWTRACCFRPALLTSSPGAALANSYRPLTSPFLHLGLLHLLLNSMSFLPISTTLERRTGSLYQLSMLLSLSLSNSLGHLLISYALYATGIHESSFTSCSVGLSGVIFSLLVIHSATPPTPPTLSVFGLFSVPTAVYPWVLLLLMQILMPKVSFVGHLAGIVSGYLVAFGWLQWSVLSPRFIARLESSHALDSLVRLPSYIVGTQTGLGRDAALLPVASAGAASSAQQQGGIGSYLHSLFRGGNQQVPVPGVTRPARGFEGQGYVLGTGAALQPMSNSAPPIPMVTPLPTAPKN